MRHHTSRVLLRTLQAWADVTAENKVARWHRERQAREHNNT